jgi:hypothetical protein
MDLWRHVSILPGMSPAKRVERGLLKSPGSFKFAIRRAAGHAAVAQKFLEIIPTFLRSDVEAAKNVKAAPRETFAFLIDGTVSETELLD